MAVGQPINQQRVKRATPTAGGPGLTSNQKTGLMLAAVFCGPALLKRWADKPAAEKVDLTGFNIVTQYETPAIDKHDSTVRIEFCSSWGTNGQFRRTASALQQAFPGLKVEGGPYTPSVPVQYAVRGVRVAQVGVAVALFFGEQIAASLRRPSPSWLGQMRDNKLAVAGGVYALDVVAQTMKAINGFEMTYNGHVLHSKLKSGAFPEPGAVVEKLKAIMHEEAANLAKAAN